MRLCVWMRSAKLTLTGNITLTIRTFLLLFSPRHYDHILPHARRVFGLVAAKASALRINLNI